MCRTPRWASASITAFCTAGVEPIVAASPMPFAPSGFSGVGRLGRVHLERRQLGRRRHGVLRQVRGDRIGVAVVDDLLVQRLADAGGDAAVLLALDEQRVEHGAAVVDRDVPHEAHLAGVGVDLDHRDVGAERERRAVLVEVELAGQRSALVGGATGEVAPGERLRRHTGDADRAGRRVDDDVGDVGFEQPSGQAPSPS